MVALSRQKTGKISITEHSYKKQKYHQPSVELFLTSFSSFRFFSGKIKKMGPKNMFFSGKIKKMGPKNILDHFWWKEG